jgi:hypothetical protein
LPPSDLCSAVSWRLFWPLAVKSIHPDIHIAPHLSHIGPLLSETYCWLAYCTFSTLVSLPVFECLFP